MNILEIKEQLEAGTAFVTPLRSGYYAVVVMKSVVVDQSGNTQTQPETIVLKKQDAQNFVVQGEQMIAGGNAILDAMDVKE